MSAFTDALNTTATKTPTTASPFMSALGIDTQPQTFANPNVPKLPASTSPFNPNNSANKEFNTQLDQRTQGPVKSFFSSLANTFSPQNIVQTAQNPLGLQTKAPAMEFKVGEGLNTQEQQNAKTQVIKEQQLGTQSLPQTATNMDLGKETQNLARMVPRAVAEIAQSFTPTKYQQPIEPISQSPIFRFLTGDETLKPLAQQAVEGEQSLKEKGFGKASTPLAVLGVAANTALAVSPLLAPLTSLAEDAVKQLAKEASTKELTITFADAQKITSGVGIDEVPKAKIDAFKAVANEHSDLLKAFSNGGVDVLKTEETPFSSFLKKAAGETPQEGVSYALPGEAANPNVPIPPKQITTREPVANEAVTQSIEAKNASVTPKTAPETAIEPKTSVISYIDKNGEKVYTKLSSQELAIAKDEVKNIPSAKGSSQIHLDAVTPQQQTTGKEITREEFIQGHPQAQEVFNNISPIESKPTVEGQTPSKIATSIEQKAVEQKLTQGFEGVAGYDKITIADQAERATKLMSNTEKAMSVIRGESALPDGLRGTALITAAEEHIARTGDVKMAYELANSPLVSETSAAAQELRLAAEREPDSLTRKLQEVRQAKEQAAIKKVGDLKKARTRIKNEIKASIKPPKAKEWASFLDSIKCT